MIAICAGVCKSCHGKYKFWDWPGISAVSAPLPQLCVVEPRFTLLSHQVRPEGGVPEQTEVVLRLGSPPPYRRQDGPLSRREAHSAPARARRLSEDLLPEAWRQRGSLFGSFSPTRRPTHRRSREGTAWVALALRWRHPRH